MSCTSCQALQEQWDIAAANLARASEEARDQGSFRSLAPYPWTCACLLLLFFFYSVSRATQRKTDFMDGNPKHIKQTLFTSQQANRRGPLEGSGRLAWARAELCSLK